MKFNDAFAKIKSLHPRAEPNQGFIKQLIEYEKKIA